MTAYSFPAAAADLHRRVEELEAQVEELLARPRLVLAPAGDFIEAGGAAAGEVWAIVIESEAEMQALAATAGAEGTMRLGFAAKRRDEE